MRFTFFIIFVLIGIANGFFGPINQLLNQAGSSLQSATNGIGNSVHSATNHLGQTLEQSWQNITGHIESVIGQLTNSINELKAATEVLWERLFTPAFDTIIKGGEFILNEQLNTLNSMFNNPQMTSEKLLSEKYIELMTRLKSNVHNLYETLFSMQREGLEALEKGEYGFEERIHAFYAKFDTVSKQINEWSQQMKNELEIYASTIEGDWTTIVNYLKQNMDVSVKKLVTMFEEIRENLMKNFLKVVVTVVPNAIDRIEKLKEQGLLSFYPNKL